MSKREAKRISIRQEILDKIEWYNICIGGKPRVNEIADLTEHSRFAIRAHFYELIAMGYIKLISDRPNGYKIIKSEYEE